MLHYLIGLSQSEILTGEQMIGTCEIIREIKDRMRFFPLGSDRKWLLCTVSCIERTAYKWEFATIRFERILIYR